MSPEVYALAFRLGVPVIQYLHNYRLGCVNGFFLNHGSPCQTCMHGNFGKAFRTACWHGSHLQSGIMGLITARARHMDLFHRISHWIAISSAQKGSMSRWGSRRSGSPSFPILRTLRDGASAPPREGGCSFCRETLRGEGGGPVAARLALHSGLRKNTPDRRGGPGAHRLEAMIRAEGIRNVLFTGFLDHRQMEAVWAASACSISSLGVEGAVRNGGSRGMGRGRPVVAHSVGALPEIVDHGVDGLLVSENDPEELAGAVLSLLDDPSRAAAMGCAGSGKLRERHSRDAGWPP